MRLVSVYFLLKLIITNVNSGSRTFMIVPRTVTEWLDHGYATLIRDQTPLPH